MGKNWLANVFNWFGDALESFNPSAFRFLAAFLPYVTPVPVAWLTAHSASEFLKFTPAISFILVFALEGIGLWFTTMFVDAVVDFVRSRNWKSLFPVLMFAVTVAAYVVLLVDLNVTLESASGNTNPALSRVITLLCFLPLITGIGNGYYKMKLEHKTETQKAREHQEEVEERRRKEQLEWAKERWKLKHGISTGSNGSYGSQNGTGSGNSGTSKSSKKSSKSSRTPSINQQRVFSYLEQQVELRGGEVPSFKEVMEELELPQSTASRLRNEWLENRQ